MGRRLQHLWVLLLLLPAIPFAAVAIGLDWTARGIYAFAEFLAIPANAIRKRIAEEDYRAWQERMRAKRKVAS